MRALWWERGRGGRRYDHNIVAIQNSVDSIALMRVELVDPPGFKRLNETTVQLLGKFGINRSPGGESFPVVDILIDCAIVRQQVDNLVEIHSIGCLPALRPVR